MKAWQLASLCILIIAARMVNSNLEGDILIAQRSAWNDPHNVLQTWDPTLVNPCTWLHVTCNNENSVIRLDLGNASLSGPLSPRLGGLANLQYLELYANFITGAIPTELGNLTKLVSLDLYLNRLTGSIPSSLGNIQSLVFLRLHSNNLNGGIPPTLGNLIKLAILDFSSNALSGSIPSSLGNIESLVNLRLNGNNLSGVIPEQVLDLIVTGNLTEINVSDNYMNGTTRNSGKRVTTIIQDA
ncbi:leucine-rich repeat protein 2-like [Zingiber officinale]|uniref:Leucine-rich repeat-containing N-terminal plant-type domain-containing protein n=1 Tax=Zingiber officinale TaxID=94328 RepID=A0A8J5F6H6_ZINOF|nr:leucine-rich repeat protein 2-like [Zingiber officinale]KAG6481946.1 hypothetical protein ZIOFF_058570 [Zingiber officinale]